MFDDNIVDYDCIKMSHNLNTAVAKSASQVSSSRESFLQKLLNCNQQIMCEHCIGLYYSEQCECRGKRRTTRTSIAQCNAGCLCCIIIMFSIIAYFTNESMNKYDNAIVDYCQYREDLSFIEECITNKKQNGYKRYYAYTAESCNNTMYETDRCSTSGDTLYSQSSDTCYIVSCDWNDVSFISPQGSQGMFWLSIYIITGASVLLMGILLGCCLCWMPYKNKHGDPNERQSNIGRNVQMQPTQSIFHEGGAGFH